MKAELQPFADLVNSAFERVDDAIEHLDKFFTQDECHSGCLYTFVAVKGRKLAHAIFSLSLDGLGQEAGAVLRPLLECIELLKYLREIPCAVTEALEGKLPSAGVRAKRIDGAFHKLRESLNVNASHIGLTSESMKHLFDMRAGKFRVDQEYFEYTLRANLATLFLFTGSLAQEAAICFYGLGSTRYPVSAGLLVQKANSCKESGIPLIKPVLEERAGSKFDEA